MKNKKQDKQEYVFMIGFLGEEHPMPVVADGEVWPDAQEVNNNGVRSGDQ